MGQWVKTSNGGVFVNDAGKPQLLRDGRTGKIVFADNGQEATQADLDAIGRESLRHEQAKQQYAARQYQAQQGAQRGASQVYSGLFPNPSPWHEPPSGKTKEQLQAEEGMVQGRQAIDPLAAKADRMNLSNYSPHGTILQEWLAKKAGR